MVDLQDESGKTDDTGKAGAGEDGSLGGRALRRGDLRGLLSRRRRRGRLDLRGLGGLGVLLLRRGGDTGVAHNLGGGLDGLGDGARAVGDGDGAGLGDGVGLVTVGDLGGLRAVGGVLVNDLGDDSDVASVAGGGASGSGEDSSDSELHLDGD